MKFNEIKQGQYFISTVGLYLFLKLDGNKYTVVGYTKFRKYKAPAAGKVMLADEEESGFTVVDAEFTYTVPPPPPPVFNEGDIVEITGAPYHNFANGALGEVVREDSLINGWIVKSVHTGYKNVDIQSIRGKDLTLIKR